MGLEREENKKQTFSTVTAPERNQKREKVQVRDRAGEGGSEEGIAYGLRPAWLPFLLRSVLGGM